MRTLLIFLSFLISISFSITISIGTITEKPSKKYKRYQPLKAYLEKELKKRGFEVNVRVKFARDIPSMREMVRSGEMDIFIDSLYPSLAVCKGGVCEPVLVRWKQGVRFYKTLIFVRKDSDIRSLEDLIGRKIAFKSPFSTSAYFVPYVNLKLMGFELVRLNSFRENPPEGKVGYIFAWADKNVVAWVFLKNTDAGAIENGDFKDIAGRNAENFRIIWESEEIPRHFVNFSPEIKGELRRAIVEILINMDKTKEGKEVLRKFKRTVKFELLTERDREIIEKYGRFVK